uniref:LigA n=1 Tax=Parastrongyloides trichosuri TaxID=131310 RepID=A0A0N4ZGU8_PARTI
MVCVTHRGGQDFGAEVVDVVQGADVFQQAHAIGADIVQTTDEGRDEGRARLGRQHGLGRREAQGDVGLDPLVGEGAGGAQAVPRQRQLDHDVGGDGGQLVALLDHGLEIGGHGLGRDRPLDQGADFSDDLGDVATRLGDQARIGGDAVHHPGGQQVLDDGDVGGESRLRPHTPAGAGSLRLRSPRGAVGRARRSGRRASGPAPDPGRGGRGVRDDRLQSSAEGGRAGAGRSAPAGTHAGLRRMGGALDAQPARRDGGDGAEGAARAPAPARAAGAARRGAQRAGGVRGRGRRRLRCARPRPCAGDPEPGSGGLCGGHCGRCDGGRLRPLPAGRGDGFGQDGGLSGGDGAGAAGRSDGAGADPAARDRPDPGGDRAHHRPLRRRSGRMALRRRPAAPSTGVGGGDRRALQHRRRRALGPVPALRQPAPDRGGRGARRLVQAGRRAGLSRSRPGRGAGADRGGDGGPGLGHPVAGDAVERSSGAVSLAEAGGATWRGDLAVPAFARSHRRDAGAGRAEPAVPQPARLCPGGAVPVMRASADGAGHGFLAGRASLHWAAGLSFDRLLHAQAQGMPVMRGRGLSGPGRPGRRAGRGGGASALSSGAHGRLQLGHGAGRQIGPRPDTIHGRRRDRHSGRHTGCGERPQLPAPDAGRGGGRGLRASRRRPARGRAHLSTAGPGHGPGGAGGSTGARPAADLDARASAKALDPGVRRDERKRAALPRPGQPDLEQAGPVLAGDEQTAVLGVPGDAVQQVVERVLDLVSRQQTGQVDDADHLAGRRVDADDVVGLPDVGPDLAVDPFQLVELAQRAAVQGDGDTPCLGLGVEVEKAQGRRSVGQDQPRAVVGQPPAFPRIGEAGDGLQVVRTPDEADSVDPREGEDAAVLLGQAFAEILGIEFATLKHDAVLQPHAAHAGRIAAGALDQHAVADDQALGEGGRVGGRRKKRGPAPASAPPQTPEAPAEASPGPARYARLDAGLGGFGLVEGGSGGLLGLSLSDLGVARPHVQTLDQGREGHGRIDIALGHMDAEAVGDQHRADHQQEAQGQHDHSRVLVDEVGQRIGRQQHHGHGGDDGHHHDRHVLGHAHGRQDGVDREDQVQNDDLEDGCADVIDDDVLLVLLQQVVRRGGVDGVVDLLGGLPQQEETACDQDKVAPGEGGVEGLAVEAQVEHGLGQADDPADGGQQAQAHDQGQADADTARALTMFRGQLVRQDRNEDQVVDPQHHLHDHQGHKGRPGGRIGQQRGYALKHRGQGSGGHRRQGAVHGHDAQLPGSAGSERPRGGPAGRDRRLRSAVRQEDGRGGRRGGLGRGPERRPDQEDSERAARRPGPRPRTDRPRRSVDPGRPQGQGGLEAVRCLAEDQARPDDLCAEARLSPEFQFKPGQRARTEDESRKSQSWISAPPKSRPSSSRRSPTSAWKPTFPTSARCCRREGHGPEPGARQRRRRDLRRGRRHRRGRRRAPPGRDRGRAGRQGPAGPRRQPAGRADRRQGPDPVHRASPRRREGPRHHPAQVGSRADADGHEGDRHPDPRRPRPARTDHRRPSGRQDRRRHRHHPEPEDGQQVGRRVRQAVLHLRRHRPKAFDRGPDRQDPRRVGRAGIHHRRGRHGLGTGPAAVPGPVRRHRHGRVFP